MIAPPDVVAERFPAGLDQLTRYAELLVGPGIERGLIGPREIDRVWDRHIVNCAAPATDFELVPRETSVIDVGSGAGLPGIVWGIVRPDVRVTLLEPMLRRADFLLAAIAELGLESRVLVVRGRAEDVTGTLSGHVVTARAVANIGKLAGLLLPLVAPSGHAVALKGASAADEIRGSRPELAKAGAETVRVVQCGSDWLAEPTTVVVMTPPNRSGGSARGKNHRSR